MSPLNFATKANEPILLIQGEAATTRAHPQFKQHDWNRRLTAGRLLGCRASVTSRRGPRLNLERGAILRL